MAAPASSKQVVSTVTLWDYEYATDATPLIKAQIEVSLNYDQATLASPAVILEAVKKTTTTDGNGQWSVDVVSNNAITPANTTYLVKTPQRSFQVQLPSGAGPFQASAYLVSTPVLPSYVTALGGNLTVAGTLGVTGVSTLTGGLTSPLLSIGPAPTLGALQAGISTQSIVGNGTRGTLTLLTTGSAPAPAAVLAIVTWPTAYAVRPAQGWFGVDTLVHFFAKSGSSGSLTNLSNDVALANGTTYLIDYLVIG